ncbi:MAG: hypothetical protein NTX64_02845 [Elusimicrobia bacterium]|nr:hypothetical protein [Elusimicrobiota bacterium]
MRHLQDLPLVGGHGRRVVRWSARLLARAGALAGGPALAPLLR